MADILGSIFGGGQRTNQNTNVDATTRAMNQLKYGQAADFFKSYPLWRMGEEEDAFRPAEGTSALIDEALRAYSGINAKAGESPYKLKDYTDLYGYLGQAKDEGLKRIDSERSDARSRLDARSKQAFDRLDRERGSAQSTLSSDIATAYANLDKAYTGSKADAEKRFQKGYDMTLDETQNYINKIATPEIQQQMALAGLEGSGGVGEAIGKATASVGKDLVSNLLANYNAEQAGYNTANMGYLTDIGSLNASLGSDLAKAYSGYGSQLGEAFAGMDTDLSKTYSSLGQDVFGRYQGAQSSFLESIPEVARMSSLLPEEIANARSQRARSAVDAGASALDVADYRRGLKERQYQGRSGLAQMLYTGMPYTPQTSTSTRQRSQPLWNFFGQG